MANTKQTQKRVKTNETTRLRNKSVKSAIKTAIKKAQAKTTSENINQATKLIDSAVTKGVFHKNKAARLKSRVQSLQTA